MPKTRVTCPNCRQPVLADVEQLFDVNTDPSARQRFLTGNFNLIHCPSCGYQGVVSTPLVYHDPQKELLLTFVPPDLGLPMQEQEKIIGPLINKVVNSLAPEQRKAYLFRPQTMLTLQGLVERVLEAEGITKEMIQSQQKRMALLQRMITASADDVLAEIAKQEDALIDADFFTLIGRLAQAALAGGDEQGARRLVELQKKLLSLTTFGRHLETQTREVEAAMQSLRQAGEGLTREKLLDLLIEAPNEQRLSALVGMARPGMDYAFFQMLTQRIDASRGEERTRLGLLRERLLELTRAYDQQMEAQAVEARQLLETVLEEENIPQAMEQVLPLVDNFFVQALQAEMEVSRTKGDQQRIAKLQQIFEVLQQASAPPPEIALIEELLDNADEASMRAALQAHRADLTPQFMEVLSALYSQVQNGGDDELRTRFDMLYRLAVRHSMETSLKG